MAERYRTFTRTWWADKACTIPQAGRKSYYHSTTHQTQEGAIVACKEHNKRFATKTMPERKRGPRGLCMEFESY